MEKVFANYTTASKNGGGYVEMFTCKKNEYCHSCQHIFAFIKCLPQTTDDVINLLCRIFDIKIDMNTVNPDEYELQFTRDGCVSAGMYRFVICSRLSNFSFSPILDDFRIRHFDFLFTKYCKKVQFKIQEYTVFVQPRRVTQLKSTAISTTLAMGAKKHENNILPTDKKWRPLTSSPSSSSSRRFVGNSPCFAESDDKIGKTASDDEEFIYKQRLVNIDLSNCIFHHGGKSTTTTTTTTLKLASSLQRHFNMDDTDNYYLVVYKPVRKIDSLLICDIDFCLKL